MLVFKHPKYYEEMRKRAKEFQKQQAASDKQQATQTQLETNCSSDKNPDPQASSDKHQAPGRKR